METDTECKTQLDDAFVAGPAVEHRLRARIAVAVLAHAAAVRGDYSTCLYWTRELASMSL